MSKIKIKGCGYCSKSKGCKIKKDFRTLVQNYELYTPVKSPNYLGMESIFNRLNEFILECPFGDRKFKEGDNVIFSLGVGRYKDNVKWECDRDCDDCYNDNCKDGIVTFENIRYKEYIKVNGKIYGLMRNDKWIISLEETDYNKITSKLNDADIKFFEEISEKLDPGQEKYIVFVSKEKYIKHFISKK